MTALADENAAARHRPFRGVRGMRAAMTLLGFHEEDFLARFTDDFCRLRHSRRIDPIFGIEKELAAGADRRSRALHLLHNALEHERFRHMPADWCWVTSPAEISGERLFADHVLTCLHAGDHHLSVERRRGTEIDHVDRWIAKQVSPLAARLRNAELASEIGDMITAGNDARDLDIDAIDAPIGVHVQFGDEPAADEAYSDPLHHASPARKAAAQSSGRESDFHITKSCKGGQIPSRPDGNGVGTCSRRHDLSRAQRRR